MPDPVTILLILLAYHSAALALLLYWRTSVRALPVFLAVLALHMTLNLIARGGGDMLGLTSAIGLLYGPLIYLLVREAAFANRKLHWKDAWLATPFIVGLVVPTDGDLRRWLALVVTGASLAGAVRVLLAFRAAAALSRTSRALARMHWLVWAVVGAIALAAIDAIRTMLSTSIRAASPGLDDVMFGLTLVGLIALTSWLAFGASEHVRQGGPLLASEQNLPKEPTSETPSAEAAANFARIEHVIEEKSLFLEPGLRLADLADATALTPREASHAINACFGNNFSAYINEHRARHAQGLIDAGAKTFLQVAMASGFSSKTAFNEAFKKLTGLTPTEYARGRPES